MIMLVLRKLARAEWGTCNQRSISSHLTSNLHLNYAFLAQHHDFEEGIFTDDSRP